MVIRHLGNLIWRYIIVRIGIREIPPVAKACALGAPLFRWVIRLVRLVGRVSLPLCLLKRIGRFRFDPKLEWRVHSELRCADGISVWFDWLAKCPCPCVLEGPRPLQVQLPCERPYRGWHPACSHAVPCPPNQPQPAGLSRTRLRCI